MNKLWLQSMVQLLLLLFSIQVMGAQSNCVFEPKALSESKLKLDKRISKHTWDKGAHEAKFITKDGALISAKYWACEHYGAHAAMFLGPYPKDDLDTIGRRFAQLAEIVLDANEAGIVRSYLSKNPVSVSADAKQIDIPNTGYSEFYLRYSVVYDSLVLEIKFYRD
jgi:hypothetical protein